LECRAVVDAKAEEIQVTGVPIPFIRSMLTAKHPNNIFAAALSILENEKE
jgi:hypothetical protein